MARHGVAMAMPATFHLDTFPSLSFHENPGNHVI
jgi:hypothetical protein